MLKKIVVLSCCLVFCSALSAKSDTCKASSTCKPSSTDVSNGKVIVLADCKKVFNPTNGTPFCFKGCDVPLDCKGNKQFVTLKKSQKWACDKETGERPCGGQCEIVNRR